MSRVYVGHQVVVGWFPLREGLENDLEKAARHLARAKTKAKRAAINRSRKVTRRGKKSKFTKTRIFTREAETAIENDLNRGVKVLRRYPLDLETIFTWARSVSVSHPGFRGSDTSPGRDDDDYDVANLDLVMPIYQLTRNRKVVRLVSRLVHVIEKARDQLVLPNLRLVLKDVFRYNPSGMKRSDLFQEGILGLHRAVFRYKPEKGTRFSTYATYWIRQSIRKSLIDRSRLIRIPQAVQEELRNPEPKIKPAEARRVRRVMGETVSMSADADSDPMDHLSFGARNVNCASMDEEMHLGVIPRAVERALGYLDIREREVVKRRFGIGGDKAQTLEEIGVALHLSRERIRQIEREALEKMKKGEDLQAVYEEMN